ncbi:MAG: glucosamine-6-phosphate deaminase [Rhodothermaeota bacterium MED-G19]|nr:MAG: glucosamine-6-phosphate deaminase [Rhodothermaeota bacterium MED-G19]
MGHKIKINSNPLRSFCYYNSNGKRIKVYNGKQFNEDLYPNKEKDLIKRTALLKRLKNIIDFNLGISKSNKNQRRRRSDNLYDQSVFKERIAIELYEHPKFGSNAAANEIANLIKEKQKNNKNCVLGLATGSSPISIYEELVRMHKEENLSFHNVITFNLDEYLPMDPNSIHSYHKFMFENLFDHIDIDPNNINIPNGNIDSDKTEKHCVEFENKIKKEGGLDFQLLGIGRNGHIGFNEPGSIESSVTRKVKIEITTRFDAASEFGGINNVPKDAISMGIRTIMSAKRVVLVAWGDGKAKVVKKAVEEEENELVPASFLQTHPNCLFVLDKESSSQLNRMNCPWVFTDITKKPSSILSSTIIGWTDFNIKKAVIWLSIKKNKSILQLTDEDYQENGMGGIFEKYVSAYETNIKVFNMIQNTITGWPGGKPNADDAGRPERAKPSKKRVLIFSPHPDDDVISMGGTFERLIKQGHEVHVAYNTSGNIAVNDNNVLEITELIQRLVTSLSPKELNTLMSDGKNKLGKNHIIWARNFHKSISGLLMEKIDVDGFKIVNQVKGIIRKSEAYQACQYLGLKNEENIHYLDMPFYQTGTIKKKDISDEDIKIVQNLITKIKPHQIYAAGDLSDPHGTHRLCLRSIYRAIDNLKSKLFMKDCYVWLYRGAWNEWKVYDIDMSVPLSPEQVIKKRRAIFKHQSQKDGIVFPGEDVREFWQRAEDRNKNTAEFFSKLGFAKYSAMEGFKRYRF